ncbi:hypothetical protein FJZ17_02265 [Candidatus Pacearchaeota archaeon]|nr:hypothetical protein [Candidatus Pacearchaeota archaeon]
MAETKKLWEFPFIEINGITRVQPEQIPEILTITNEQRTPRTVPAQVIAEIERNRMARILKRGLVYFVSSDLKRIVSAPNRAPDFKRILEQDVSIRSYLDMLESQVGNVIATGALNPGFEDFTQLERRYNRPHQFLLMKVRDITHERAIRILIACASSRSFPARILETPEGYLNIARVKYTEPTSVT